MTQDTHSLKPLSTEPIRLTPTLAALEGALLLLLRVTYDVQTEDIDRVKCYGRIMFLSGQKTPEQEIPKVETYEPTVN